MAKSTDDRPSPPEAPTESASKIVDLLAKFLGVLVTAATIYSTLTKSPALLAILLGTTLFGGFYVIFAGDGKGGKKYVGHQRNLAKWITGLVAIISIGGGLYYFLDKPTPVVQLLEPMPSKARSVLFVALDGDDGSDLSPSRSINGELNRQFRADTGLWYGYLEKDTIGKTSVAVQDWGRVHKLGVVIWGLCERRDTLAHITLNFELLDTAHRFLNTTDPVDMQVELANPNTLTAEVDLQLKGIVPSVASILPIQQPHNDSTTVGDAKRLLVIAQLAQVAVSYEKGSYAEVQPIIDTLIKWNRHLHCMDTSPLYLMRGNARGTLSDRVGAQTDWKIAAESYRMTYQKPALSESRDTSSVHPITAKLTRSIAAIEHSIKVKPQEDFAAELDTASRGATWQLSGLNGSSESLLYQISVSKNEVVFMSRGAVAARLPLTGASMQGEFAVESAGEPARKGAAVFTVQSSGTAIAGTINIGGSDEQVRFSRISSKTIGLKPKIVPHTELIKPAH